MEEISYSELIKDSIRLHFEQNEDLNRMRSGLHVQAMKMLHELTRMEKDEPPCASNLEQRGMLQLLNYLIVDYFNWHGFRNTLETFALETGEKSRPKPREKLQRELNGKFDHLNLPILLQMLLKETNKEDNRMLNESKWEHISKKASSIPKKLKKSHGRRRAVKDVSGQAEQPRKQVEKDAICPAPAEENTSNKEIQNNASVVKSNSSDMESPSKVKNLNKPGDKDTLPKDSSGTVEILQDSRQVVEDIPAKQILSQFTMINVTPAKEIQGEANNLRQSKEIPKKMKNSLGIHQLIKKIHIKKPSKNITNVNVKNLNGTETSASLNVINKRKNKFNVRQRMIEPEVQSQCFRAP
ncbi:uncharacterized protein [Drosophila virilis]|uniref:Uncharacterized protein n=1 Tax=Drosophila virilis TaxID=7244 RepID=A0A0Q9W190_DROVI|nr:uncharacterized protein LOC26530512 [Drosophila virilis]KRF78844.1 uncharacterized protein Dvir_GJ25742 [Drosophila virilis]